MNIIALAIRSLLSRRYTVALTMVSIAISVLLFLGVLRLKSSLEKSFTNTISGTDLVVGARTGEEQLVLATIFHIGDLRNNVSWSTYEFISRNPLVKWSIPMTFGDSHKGYKIIATDSTFFSHYKYADKRSINFDKGNKFLELFDVVIGSDVAVNENYALNDEIFLQHGSGSIGNHQHEHHHFSISGVLKKTGTPLDKSIFISLKANEAIHLNYVEGKRDEDLEFSSKELMELNLLPKNVSAFMVGLKSRSDILELQVFVNKFKREPLTAASPALTLVGLWNIMDNAEFVLYIISIFILISGLISMLLILFSGIHQRRREVAIFRSLGAKMKDIYLLIMGESFLISFGGVVLGAFLLVLFSVVLSPIFEKQYGLLLTSAWTFSSRELIILFIISLIGLLVGIIPAFRMHQMALNDGLSIKL